MFSTGEDGVAGNYGGFRDAAVAVLAKAEEDAKQDTTKKERAGQVAETKKKVAAMRLPTQTGATDLALDDPRAARTCWTT